MQKSSAQLWRDVFAGPQRAISQPQVLLWTFAGTMFLSALMLFSVQPMFARMALPLLGGTPAVWAVSMCFFQAALLAGYCYAHALMRLLSPGRAVAAHGILLALTFFALPIALPSTLSEPPEGNAYGWLMGVLALGVGAPFFTVSATAPLLQSWFARTHHEDAADPYFLYGASNLGSLLALLAYPLLIETTSGLRMQAALWTVGYAVLASLIVLCGAAMIASYRGAPAAALPSAGSAGEAKSTPVRVGQLVSWCLLAAIPSALLVAVTTYITTDIASAPFLWVIPLALFLLTFILVFRQDLQFNYRVVQVGLVLANLVAVCPPNGYVMLASLAGFMCAALVCHRELFLRRPSPEHLTTFYIAMSFGGVIGGLFSAIVAPQIFTTVLEFKLLLLAAMFAIPGVLPAAGERLRWPLLAAIAAATLLAAVGAAHLIKSDLVPSSTNLMFAVSFALVVAIALRGKAERAAAIIVCLMAGVIVLAPLNERMLHAERSFFGTLRVLLTDDSNVRLLAHGTTIHGAERVRNADGTPVTQPEPATYYHRGGPMARGLALSRERAGGAPLSIGIVGLGAGSMACYQQPGDTWRFFEIDPMVARVARNPDYFTFLSRCLPDNNIVIGDARLTLKKEADAAFDYLIIDAFSSDAIPVHLLTEEAMALYFAKLKPNGLLALHVSNRHMDLPPVVAAIGKTMPGVDVLYRFGPATSKDGSASQVMFLSRDRQAMAQLRVEWPDAVTPDATGIASWTDDFSDVLGAIKRRYWR